MQASITVVIPTHRRHDLLPKALSSALAQTRSDVEVVVAVDGDDPEAKGIAEGFQDPRVTVIGDGLRRGEAMNSVRGISHGTAPYFALLHDDDEWEPNLVERLLAPLEQDSSLALAFADHWITDESGRIDHEATDSATRRHGRAGLARGRYQPFYRLALIDQAVPPVMATVYRRNAVDLTEVMPDLPGQFDYWLAWLAAKGGTAAYYVPERLSRYRAHAGQATMTTRPTWPEAEVMMYSRLVREREIAELHPELRLRLAYAHRQRALTRRRSGLAGARRSALQSVRWCPSVKSLAVVALVCAPRRILGVLGLPRAVKNPYRSSSTD